MARIWLALALVLGVSGPAWAGIEEGRAALEGGDYETALSHLLPLAQAGDPRAQFYLGRMNEDGFGVPRNEAEAALWFQKSAEKGHAGAQFKLGRMYETGVGVLPDVNKAALWYRKAAESGHAQAQYFLAKYLYDGIAGPIDVRE